MVGNSCGKVIPELEGRLTGYSLRVPVPVVSIVDLTVTLERDVTSEEVNNAFREAAATGPLKGILGYSDEPLLSSDYQGYNAWLYVPRIAFLSTCASWVSIHAVLNPSSCKIVLIVWRKPCPVAFPVYPIRLNT